MRPRLRRWSRGERPSPGWLVCDGRVLASAEIAMGRMAKARGLLGRDHIDGALVLEGRRSVHSFTMGFDLDVAFLAEDGTVIRTLRLHRNRVTVPVWRAQWVVEAEAGAFGDWELKVGDVVEIRQAGVEEAAEETAEKAAEETVGHDDNSDGSGPGETTDRVGDGEATDR